MIAQPRVGDCFYLTTRSGPVNNAPLATTIPTASAKPPSLQYIKLCKVLKTPGIASSLGYLSLPKSDPDQHVHIAEVTGEKKTPRQSVSLQTLLSRTPAVKRHALSRKKRFGIAAALAWATLHLCDSAWLGKHVDDEKIQLFLEEETQSTLESLSANPYLCCSLNSAATQPTSPTATSQTEKFQSNQIANMTLYTLAIRLIELGLNRPFEHLRKEYNRRSLGIDPTQQPTTNTVIDDFKVATEQLDELYLECGTSYAYAVQRCLKLEFPGPGHTKSFEHRSFRQDFFSGVVAPLQATYEITPGSCSPADL